MRALGVLAGLVGVGALLFAGSPAIAGPSDQAEVSAKGIYAKCKAKRTKKAKKKCRQRVNRQARIRRQAQNTWWVDYAGTASRRPQSLPLFYGGGGPAVSELEWKQWGYPKATATGVYSEPGFFGVSEMTGEASVEATSPFHCTAQFGTKEGEGIFVYGKVTLTIPDFMQGGRPTTHDISNLAGRQVCQAPVPA